MTPKLANNFKFTPFESRKLGFSQNFSSGSKNLIQNKRLIPNHQGKNLIEKFEMSKIINNNENFSQNYESEELTEQQKKEKDQAKKIIQSVFRENIIINKSELITQNPKLKYPFFGISDNIVKDNGSSSDTSEDQIKEERRKRADTFNCKKRDFRVDLMDFTEKKYIEDEKTYEVNNNFEDNFSSSLKKVIEKRNSYQNERSQKLYGKFFI